MVEIKKETLDRIFNAERVYFHSNCPDGIMARNILKYLFDEVASAAAQNSQYGGFYYPASPSNELPLIKNAIFIDMAPIASQFEDFLKAGAVILDHHESNRYLFDQYKEQYPEQLVFGENADHESGAMLAYKVLATYFDDSRFYTYIIEAKKAADYISISDCWHKQDPRFESGRALAHFITLQGNDYNNLADPEIMDMAELIYTNKKKEDTKIAKKAEKVFITTKDGQKIKVCFLNRENVSDVSEILRNDYGVNLVVGWQKDTYINKKDESKINKIIKFSLRSDDSVNCRKIAELLGGGGHDRAAGFSIPDSSIVLSPIMELFSEKLGDFSAE